MAQQLFAAALAAKLLPHVQILEVDPGLCEERREVGEEQREAGDLVADPRDHDLGRPDAGRTAARGPTTSVAWHSWRRRSNSASSRISCRMMGASAGVAGLIRIVMKQYVELCHVYLGVYVLLHDDPDQAGDASQRTHHPAADPRARRLKKLLHE